MGATPRLPPSEVNSIDTKTPSQHKLSIASETSVKDPVQKRKLSNLIISGEVIPQIFTGIDTPNKSESSHKGPSLGSLPKLSLKKSIFDTEGITGSIAGPLGTQSQFFQQSKLGSNKKPQNQSWQSQKNDPTDQDSLFKSSPRNLFDGMSNHSSEELPPAQPQAPPLPPLKKKDSLAMAQRPWENLTGGPRKNTPDSIPGDVSASRKKLDSDIISNFSFDNDQGKSLSQEGILASEFFISGYPKVSRHSLDKPPE